MSEKPSFNGSSQLLTPEEAALHIRVCEKTLRAIRQQGLIPYVAVTTRKKLYRLEDLDAYLSSQVKTETPPPPPTRNRRGKPLSQSGNVLSFSQGRRERLAARKR